MVMVGRLFVLFCFGIFNNWNKTDLKLQLLEEPFVLAGLVSLLELDLGTSLGLVFESRVSEDILVDNSFVQGDSHRVPCGHEVIITINFHKWLDLWPLGDFHLVHGSCHFAGIAVDSSHQSMALGSVWGTIINVLHNDFFASGVASSQDQNHIPGFHELAHFSSTTWDYSWWQAS